ncbi:MAG: hypothetical protein Q7J78_01440 [Clostridiales bacterium]|nr:hypothetical protein [Clostridiales bacterium]
MPSITAIVPGLGSDDGDTDDAAGLGASEGVDVGSGVPVVPASSGGDGACSFSAVDSSVPAGLGGCVSAEKMI